MKQMIERLRATGEGIREPVCDEAADAIEQLQAERDEHKRAAEFNFEQYQDAARLLCEVSEERDELKRSLENVTDDMNKFDNECNGLTIERDELAAQVEVLREALSECASKLESQVSRNAELPWYYNTVVKKSYDALSTTPPAALAALRAKHLEEAAKVCDARCFIDSDAESSGNAAADIRALI